MCYQWWLLTSPGIDWVENWVVKLTHHLPPVNQFVGIKVESGGSSPPGHELHSVHEYCCCPSEVQHRRSSYPSNYLYHGTYLTFFIPNLLLLNCLLNFVLLAARPCLTFSILLLSRQTSSKLKVDGVYQIYCFKGRVRWGHSLQPPPNWGSRTYSYSLSINRVQFISRIKRLLVYGRHV